jgi:hypothetical protein
MYRNVIWVFVTATADLRPFLALTGAYAATTLSPSSLLEKSSLVPVRRVRWLFTFKVTFTRCAFYVHWLLLFVQISLLVILGRLKPSIGPCYSAFISLCRYDAWRSILHVSSYNFANIRDNCPCYSAFISLCRYDAWRSILHVSSYNFADIRDDAQ